MLKTYSVNDLLGNLIAVIKEAETTKAPVFISHGGHASVVMVDAETYVQNMQALSEFERIYQIR